MPRTLRPIGRKVRLRATVLLRKLDGAVSSKSKAPLKLGKFRRLAKAIRGTKVSRSLVLSQDEIGQSGVVELLDKLRFLVKQKTSKRRSSHAEFLPLLDSQNVYMTRYPRLGAPVDHNLKNIYLLFLWLRKTRHPLVAKVRKGYNYFFVSKAGELVLTNDHFLGIKLVLPSYEASAKQAVPIGAVSNREAVHERMNTSLYLLQISSHMHAKKFQLNKSPTYTPRLPLARHILQKFGQGLGRLNILREPVGSESMAPVYDNL